MPEFLTEGKILGALSFSKLKKAKYLYSSSISFATFEF